MHHKCFDICFEVEAQDKDFKNLTLKQSSKEPKNNDSISEFNTSFFHGKFKKYSAEIAKQQYILKMQQKDCPELPEVEWISNKIYLLFGINVAKFCMIRFNNQIPTFVTKNFMKKNTPSNLVHIYHFLEKSEEYNCENLIRIIFNKCGTLIDIKRFIEMVLADSIIGNHDRHGRNIGLIQSGPSKYELSPIYDNPSYIGIEDDIILNADLNPVGKIFTSCSNEPTLSNYISEFKKIGYEEIVDDFICKILKLQTKWELIVGQSTITDKRKNALLKIINKRIGEIE
ncbi:MAG: HipA domain-containing protein [Bacteriovoracaceae bacterium]|nr:HipA domain-containing protein [Bacteriovoracaceae bacterium]